MDRGGGGMGFSNRVDIYILSYKCRVAGFLCVLEGEGEFSNIVEGG